MGDTIQNINGSMIATRGGRIVSHGDITGGRSEYNFENADLRETLINLESSVTRHIHESDNFDKMEKSELTNLVKQLVNLLAQAPPEKKEAAETVIEAARQLVSTATQKKPNKPMLSIIASGLKQGAKSIADALPKVLEVASQIIGIVGKLSI